MKITREIYENAIRPVGNAGKIKFFLAALLWCVSLPLFSQSGITSFRLTDDFADRPNLQPPVFFISGSLSNATTEAGEPLIDGVSSGQTVWGSWTAPSSGIMALSVAQFNPVTFSPLLTVYTGSDFPHLSLVASNNYLIRYEDEVCGYHWRERGQITFHVAAGEAYQICVDSAIITDASLELQETPITSGGGAIAGWSPVFTTNILQGGPFILDLQFTAAPANDDFTNRTRLTGSQIDTQISNAGATKETGEPEHLGNPGGSSVWYSWTAPASGRVTLSTNDVPPYAPPSSGDGEGDGSTTTSVGPPTCGNEIDQNPPSVFYPIFAAYTGTAVDTLTPADNHLMSLAAYPNAVEFDAVKGQTYQIAFDGNMGTTGDIPFFLSLTTPASNDNFTHRIPLHGVSVIATGYNAGATYQSGAPVLVGSSGKTAWWSWIAPVSGSVSLDLTGSDYPFPVAVFTGSSLPSLQLIAAGAGGLSFNAIRGHTYQIAVSDDNGLTGAISLKLLAPIVNLPLEHSVKIGSLTILTYGASPGDVITLLSSTDDENWTIAKKTTALGNAVSFYLNQPPTKSAPFYRAVISDFSPR